MTHSDQPTTTFDATEVYQSEIDDLRRELQRLTVENRELKTELLQVDPYVTSLKQLVRDMMRDFRLTAEALEGARLAIGVGMPSHAKTPESVL